MVAPGPVRAVILPLTRASAIQLALLLLAAALLFGIVALVRWSRRRPVRRPAVASGLLAALAGVALALAFTVAIDVPTYPVPPLARFATNPVPDTAETLATAKATYERLCLICHGPRGRGDGAAAFTMNPRPLDLKIHVPLHADGEHFYWISEGIPGTAMPGWKAQLSDPERWGLVRYLRALAAAP